MDIIDSQIHVWPPHRPDRPLGTSGLDRTPYSYQELLAAMDVAGVRPGDPGAAVVRKGP